MTTPDPSPGPLLLQSGLFSCPRCGSGPGTVAQLISLGQLGFPVAGRCNRCEHQYAFTAGTPSTTTTGTANTQGATALTVASGTGFVTAGAFLTVDDASVDGGAEVLVQGAAGSATSIPLNAASPLRLTHAAGATVQAATLGPLGPMT